MVVQNEILKDLGERALAACRHLQSKQTGYIHLNYTERENTPQTIPLLENFLFCYALFRSRMSEQVNEGKSKLKNLLSFQVEKGEDRGNFPMYLHDYPNCFDPSLGIQLLAPLYWMIKQFDTILGNELNHQIRTSVSEIFLYSLNKEETKPFPYFLKIRLYAAQWAFGRLFKNEAWEKNGKEKLDYLAEKQLSDWSTTKQLGDILIGLQMCFAQFSESPWRDLWNRIEETWNSSLAAYMGPCFREWDDGSEPKASLYDLFCGYFSGCFSNRAFAVKEHLIHGILIQPSDIFKKFCPKDIKEKHWQITSDSDYALTLLEKISEINPVIENTFTPLRFIWGGLKQLHSLVFQGGNCQKVTFSQEKNTLFLDCELKETREDKEREIEFFVSNESFEQFRIDQSQATLFQLDQTVQLTCQHFDFFFTLELIKGEGQFVGHLMRGNRPSQIDDRGNQRFHAHDWTFFIRSIRRQPQCTLKVKIEYQRRIG